MFDVIFKIIKAVLTSLFYFLTPLFLKVAKVAKWLLKVAAAWH